MKQTNQKIASKTIHTKKILGIEFSVDDTEAESRNEFEQNELRKERTLLGIARRSRQLLTIPDQIAGDKFFQKNHIWPGAKSSFPFNPKLQTVDKFYPFAEGGPLFVDEIQRKDDIGPFLQKKDAMRELGHRYLLIVPGMQFHEALEELA